MIAREWKARLPSHKESSFLEYLHQTGIKDTSSTPGFEGAQIFVRSSINNSDIEHSEVTLITYWDNVESIKAFAGEDISKARLYPDDYQYDLDADTFVTHYEVVKDMWSQDKQAYSTT